MLKFVLRTGQDIFDHCIKIAENQLRRVRNMIRPILEKLIKITEKHLNSLQTLARGSDPFRVLGKFRTKFEKMIKVCSWKG